MIFKDIINIYAERARAKKALRVLSKQRWSVEFLVWLASEAASKYKKTVVFTIKNGRDELVIHAMSDQQEVVEKFKKIEEMNEEEKLQAMLDVATAQGVI